MTKVCCSVSERYVNPLFEVFDGGVPHLYICGNRILEQNDVLIHNRQRTGEHAAVDPAHGLAIEEDFSAPGLVKP